MFNAGNLFATTVALVGGQGHAGGYSDGDTYHQALFRSPSGMTMDGYGDLWVADRGNNAIRFISSPLASQGGGSETLTFAAFPTNLIVQPIGVVFDSFGDLYILDYGNGKNGNVTEYDTEYGYCMFTNAINLTNAAGMTIDANNYIYVTVNTNQILRFTAPGVSNLVTTITNSGTSLQGLIVKRVGNSAGMIAVCDSGRNGIYLVNPTSGVWTTNAGFHGTGDFPNGTDASAPQFAQFNQPMDVAETGDGSLIVTDYGNNRVKVVKASDGGVTNLYGVVTSDWYPSPYPGFSSYLTPASGAPEVVKVPDTMGGVAARQPDGIVYSSDGTVYVTEEYYNVIRDVTATGLPLPPPLPPAAPATPTGLTATTNVNSVTLNWNGSTGATNYTVSESQAINGNYTPIFNTSTTAFTYTNVSPGATYYFVVSASNTGGTSTNSAPVSATIPIPPPGPPVIGWFDYEGNYQSGFFTVLHPVTGTPFIAHNDLMLAINPNVAVESGLNTYYLDGAPPLTNNPSSTNGFQPPQYSDGLAFAQPLSVSALPDLLVAAVNENGVGEYSSVATAEFLFEVANPTITGNNAAQFQVSDITTNVSYWYTIDGSIPTNDPNSTSIGPIVSTNGQPITLSLNGSTNIFFQIRAFRNNYFPSGTAPQNFSPSTFIPNSLTWGFAYGECSSRFVGAAGQTFYAPVTLTMLPGVTLYSLQFNMTVSSTGAGVTNPAPAAGPFNFQSMLMEPGVDTNAVIPVLQPIPPWVYAAEETAQLPPQDYVTNGTGQVFVDLLQSNGNELAVGWAERYGFTNLYNTKVQTLIAESLAHDDLFPTPQEPNGVIVGGYSFQISPGATNGQQYQIQLNGASGTSDGIGAVGNSVTIVTQDSTNGTSLGSGSLNAIKNVTVGSLPYLVGDVYPFRWFNAGDFGTSNLQANGSADMEQVFQSAVYGLNTPPPGSDMLDAMDSSGGLGALDSDPTSAFYNYWTNAGTLTTAQEETLLGGNITNINQMAFGDGQLDVADVFVTFLRSQFTNQLIWFQREWTNGTLVATASYAPGIIPGVVQKQLGGGKVLSADGSPTMPLSVTNTPIVNFSSTDFLANAGETLSIPVNVTIFGQYPLRMLMLNFSVVPLDGSPVLTTPIQFSASTALNALAANATFTESSGAENYAGAWMPTNITLINGSIDYSRLAGITGQVNLGTLTVVIPTNATSMSSYALHFDHASASPNGIGSFPKNTLTGLITLSSRNTSYYNDGIPDSWRLRYFGTIYNYLSVSNADADGTGMENWQKYQAGLDPLNPQSKLTTGTDQSMAQSPQDSVVDWPTVNGKTYVIQRSVTLFPANWIPVSTNIGNGTYMEIHDSPPGPNRFYRVETP